LEIRDTVLDDFAEITAIYNEVLANSTAIYNDRPASCEERIAWWRSRQAQEYPVLVAVDGSNVRGFASFGDFRYGPGYRFTVECTVHIQSESRGQGIGNELMKSLIARARALEKHTMIAAVDSGNAASLRFFEAIGFERVAHLKEVGFKFNRFLDLVLLQYRLTPPKGEQG